MPTKFAAIAYLGLLCVPRTQGAVPSRVVNVVVTFPPHHDLIRAAGESWRHGYRAVVLTEADIEGPLPSPHSSLNDRKHSRDIWYGYPDDLRGEKEGSHP